MTTKNILGPFRKSLITTFSVIIFVLLFLQISEYRTSQQELQMILQNPPSKEELMLKNIKNISEYGIDGKIYHCNRCIDTLGGCDRWENKVCTSEERKDTYYKECQDDIFGGCPMTARSALWDLIVLSFYIPLFPIIFILSFIFYHYKDKKKQK